MSKRRRSSRPPKNVTVTIEAPPANRFAVPPWAGRAWLATMIAATLWVTWPLWSVHDVPPLLPIVSWPAWIPWAWLLLAAAAAFVVRPREGLIAFVVVSAAAMSADQTRMQPQMFSFWLLMLGLLPLPKPQFIARCHLASLWFFSGLHKLFSPGYFNDVAPFLWQGMVPESLQGSPAVYQQLAAGILAGAELLLGVVVFIPPLRRAAAVAAALLHLGVVWVLHRQHDWNTSVWPWNLALAVVGAMLIATWKTPLREDLRTCGRPAFVAGLLLFLAPLMFYVGLLDAYLSNCLYSANTPIAFVDPAAPGEPTYLINGLEGPYWKNLNVPQPPAHRIFEQYFRAVAKPGDAMLIEDPRAWARWTGRERYEWRFRETGIERKQLPPK